jgi:hypothetical protein
MRVNKSSPYNSQILLFVMPLNSANIHSYSHKFRFRRLRKHPSPTLRNRLIFAKQALCFRETIYEITPYQRYVETFIDLFFKIISQPISIKEQEKISSHLADNKKPT